MNSEIVLLSYIFAALVLTFGARLAVEILDVSIVEGMVITGICTMTALLYQVMSYLRKMESRL